MPVVMNIPESLQLGEVIHQARHKPESHATLEGTYDGQPVIVKRGDGHLRREEAVLGAVDFDGIPKVVGYLEENGQNILIMGRLPGVTLSQYIALDDTWRSRELSIQEALHIVDGLSLCFESLHEAGYLYRDLNLSHVIISESRVGLVDHEWCVESDASGVGRVDNQAGTWETMAPEEFVVDNSMARTSNTYTLGVVLLQLVTGKNPFFVSVKETPNTELQRLRAKELHRQLPSIQTGHTDIDHILRQALQPEPSKRYQSVAAFRDALALLAEE